MMVGPLIAQEAATPRAGGRIGDHALPRVASSGLCADLMLLLLADDAQIVSLSAQSTGPLALYADKARRFPRLLVLQGGRLVADGAPDEVLSPAGMEAHITR